MIMKANHPLMQKRTRSIKIKNGTHKKGDEYQLLYENNVIATEQENILQSKKVTNNYQTTDLENYNHNN